MEITLEYRIKSIENNITWIRTKIEELSIGNDKMYGILAESFENDIHDMEIELKEINNRVEELENKQYHKKRVLECT